MSIELNGELVSVIIPVYNSQAFLNESIKSVLNQKYQNIEVVLVDDGSTDNSVLIFEEFASQDNRIKIIKQSNNGPGSARNTGIINSTGKYIVFIDSDDVADPLLIQNLVNLSTNNATQLTLCGIKVFQKEFKEKDIVKILNVIKTKENVLEIKDFLEYLAKYKTNIYFGAPYGKLFSRDIIMEYNIRFDEHSNVAEDFMFNVNYYSYVDNVSVSDNSLYFHRADNLNSISKTTKDINNLCLRYKEIFFEYEKLLKKHNINQNKINNFVIFSIYKMILNYSKSLSLLKNNRFSKINKFSRAILEDNIVIRVRHNIDADSFRDRIIRYAVIKNKKSILNSIIFMRYLLYKTRKY